MQDPNQTVVIKAPAWDVPGPANAQHGRSAEPPATGERVTTREALLTWLPVPVAVLLLGNPVVARRIANRGSYNFDWLLQALRFPHWQVDSESAVSSTVPDRFVSVAVRLILLLGLTFIAVRLHRRTGGFLGPCGAVTGASTLAAMASAVVARAGISGLATESYVGPYFAEVLIAATAGALFGVIVGVFVGFDGWTIARTAQRNGGDPIAPVGETRAGIGKATLIAWLPLLLAVGLLGNQFVGARLLKWRGESQYLFFVQGPISWGVARGYSSSVYFAEFAGLALALVASYVILRSAVTSGRFGFVDVWGRLVLIMYIANVVRGVIVRIGTDTSFGGAANAAASSGGNSVVIGLVVGAPMAYLATRRSLRR